MFEKSGFLLPEIPDDDSDFTPDLARKIIAAYQAILAPPVEWPPQDAWDRVMADPRLARARSKLSVHELRLIIGHARADKGALNA